MPSHKILVVIAGGGFAQVESATGCLMALADAGLPVRDANQVQYRANSAGAIVASVIAAGWSPSRIAAYLSDHDTADFLGKRWDWMLRAAAILCHVSYGPTYQRRGTEQFLRDVLWDDETILPAVTVIMTRLNGGERVETPATYSRVLASSAIDGVFPPVSVDGELFIDGGYTDNVPLEPWHTEQFGRVYLILPPRDPNAGRHHSTMIGRLLQQFDLKLSQEMDEAERIFGSGYYRNVTLLRPPPIESSLLALSPNRRVMRHAYEWALGGLGQS